ncbi:MAG: hypothetical protein HYY40_07465 [Bacteroidetes bacterium]|nr:hypothetical protein [Bacteroidota bacterium]
MTLSLILMLLPSWLGWLLLGTQVCLVLVIWIMYRTIKRLSEELNNLYTVGDNF